MTLETWLAFLAAACLISISPGAGVVSCLGAGLRFGLARAMWNIFGLITGILFVLAIVAAGLGALLAASTIAFTVVKWLGVAYLVWLGVQQWRAPALPVDANAAGSELGGTRRQLYVRGFLVNATNPKGIVFMLAVLPQFIDPGAAAGAAVRDLRRDADGDGPRRDDRLHGVRGDRAAHAAQARARSAR